MNDYLKRVEKMLLFQLTLNIKSGDISLEEAQEVARLYLALKPTSKEELLQGLIDLGRKHEVIKPVVAAFTKEYDQEFSAQVLSRMKDKLTHNDINGAIDVGKQGEFT